MIAAGACCALVEALKIAGTEDTKRCIAQAIANLSVNSIGCAALIAAGACGALVEALKTSVTEETRESITGAIGNLFLIQQAMARAGRHVSSAP